MSPCCHFEAGRAMREGLGCGHLAPLPLAVCCDAIDALLDLICNGNVEEVFHFECRLQALGNGLLPLDNDVGCILSRNDLHRFVAELVKVLCPEAELPPHLKIREVWPNAFHRFGP